MPQRSVIIFERLKCRTFHIKKSITVLTEQLLKGFEMAARLNAIKMLDTPKDPQA